MATVNIYDMADTWNDGGTTFTAIKMDVTDTASAAGSLLMDLQVGASSVFEVRAKPTGSLGAAFIEVGNNERFFDLKDNFGTGFIASAGGSLHIGTGASSGNYVGGFHWSGGVCARIDGFLGFAGSGSLADQPDLRMTRKAAGNLRFGEADAGTSTTVLISSANPGVVTWGNHRLSTGSPVKFTTTGTLPTNIVAGTTYYVIYVSANSFQLATSFANALAGTAIDTSGGSPSGTHTVYRGAAAQRLSAQSSSTLADFPGADMVIQGSQSTGSAAGGSILFQVSPAGSAGSGQNGFQTALTIDSTKKATLTSHLEIGASSDVYTTSGRLNLASGFNWGLTIQSGRVSLANANDALTWGAGSNTADVYLYRDAANTLALRNGADAQTFNIYNTYTDATNYERFSIIAQSGGAVQIGTNKGSVGGTARALELQTDGQTRLTIPSSSGDAIFSGSVTASVSGFEVSGRGRLESGGADGKLVMRNFASAGFTQLMLGGNTAAYPSIKVSSTTLQGRLADDTAFTNIQGKLTTDTAYTAGAPTPAGYLVVYDSTGTAYKIPAEAL